MPVIKKRTKKEKLQTSTVVESRGVSTSRGSPAGFTPLTSPTCLTPTHTSPLCLTPTHTSPPCLTPTLTSPPLSPSNISTEASSSLFAAASYHGKDTPTKATQTVEAQPKSSHGKGSNPSRSSYSKENCRRSHRRKDNPLKMSPMKDESSRTSHVKEETARISHSKDEPSKGSHGKEKPRRDDPAREDPNRKHFMRKPVLREHTASLVDPTSGAPSRSRGSHHPHRRYSHQELDPASRANHGPRSSELLEASTASVKQELLHLSLARQALEAEKAELTRLLEQREGVITELRKQMHQRDKAMHTQRAQFEDALRNVQNGKRVGVCGDSPSSRGGPREELHLVRDAIASLRNNFRETDPNQHTLDTLEQAISILIERSSTSSTVGGGGGGTSNDKNSRSSDQRHQMNGVQQEASTKVIYFTERTVTPFMSTINKPLGEIRLRDFKNMFDRPGLFRFHFKSYDPEYGMVKEEIVNDDDILPGVEGKIIAWVEEDVE